MNKKELTDALAGLSTSIIPRAKTVNAAPPLPPELQPLIDVLVSDDAKHGRQTWYRDGAPGTFIPAEHPLAVNRDAVQAALRQNGLDGATLRRIDREINGTRYTGFSLVKEKPKGRRASSAA